MKRFEKSLVLVVIIVAVLAVSTGSAWATLIAYDGFGTSGPLNGSATGTGFSAGWNDPNSLGTLQPPNSLTGPSALTTSGGSVQWTYQGSHPNYWFTATRNLSSPLAYGTYYMSALYSHSDNNQNWGFTGLYYEVGGTRKRLAVGVFDSSGRATLLLDGVASTADDYGATFDTTPRLFVMKFVTSAADGGTVDAYANYYTPSENPPLAEPASWTLHTTVTGMGSYTMYSKVFMRSRLYSSGATPTAFDEFRLGTTWADVSPVPEPSTMALLATGLLGLLAYAWRKRK